MLFVIKFLLASSISYGFLNIESLRQHKTERDFYGGAVVKLSGASGNIDKTIGSVRFNNGYRSSQNEYLFLSQYKYGEANNVKNTDSGYGHLRFTHFRKHFGIENYLQIQFNEFTRLNRRLVYGAGLRFQLLNSQKIDAYLGFGGFYESEKLDETENQEATRGNGYLSIIHNFDDVLKTTLIFYYQPNFEDFEDFRLQAVLGFEFELYKNIGTTLEIKSFHDSLPPPEIEKTDVTYLMGFSVKY